jgi:FAD/FMN-containing dehydrogenase
MAVAAQSAVDIAQALAFVQRHDIRVVVKSTGHDFQGRSTAADALLIAMHEWRAVSVAPAAPCAGDQPVPAVTASGGVSWGEVYAAVPSAFTVVGGSARSVCAAGGYTLGGGHSWQSPAYGLAVDNVLAATAVLANGTAVTASRCENPDLFWALRGGGGGTFAVVTSITYRLHPVPNVGATGLYLQLAFLRGAASAQAFLEGFLAATPALLSPAATGGVWGGYFYTEATGFQAYVVYNGSQTAAQQSLAPLAALVQSLPLDVSVQLYEVVPYASMNQWHDAMDKGDATGTSLVLGSRLIPAAACTDAALRAQTAELLAGLATETTLYGHLVAGGAVAAADPDSAETSVTPAWRRAAYHLVVAEAWADNATVAEQAAAWARVSGNAGKLRGLFPDSGAYWSESDYLEPAWQQSFWGSANYERLQTIKRAYDPTGVFQCHHCVEL